MLPGVPKAVEVFRNKVSSAALRFSLRINLPPEHLSFPLAYPSSSAYSLLQIVERGGLLAIRSIARLFSIMDNSGDKKLSQAELKFGLKDYGLTFTVDEFEGLWRYAAARRFYSRLYPMMARLYALVHYVYL